MLRLSTIYLVSLILSAVVVCAVISLRVKEGGLRTAFSVFISHVALAPLPPVSHFGCLPADMADLLMQGLMARAWKQS